MRDGVIDDPFLPVIYAADDAGTSQRPTADHAPVRAARLLLVADVFMSREARAGRRFYGSGALKALLNPYRELHYL